jgi:three-Cys-motif partner protein
MADNSFFSEQSEQSAVKAAIVQKYFWSWAKVMLPRAKSGRIAYIDLFAGPGRYQDGKSSTPLLILESAIKDKDPKMRNMLVTMFNDKDDSNIQSLKNEIDALEGISGLKYPPKLMSQDIGTEMVSKFESMNMIPTLFFVDPWGYKGLSLRLINSVLKNWGCDCIFFFNYNRINMGVNNDFVLSHMEALLGKEVKDILRPKLVGLRPEEREAAIVEAISEALIGMGGNFVLPFRFKDDKGKRTSHHLIFVSKNVLGYTIMKGIMAKESSELHQGVASFEYTPATKNQPVLFELNRPLDDLKGMLMEKYSGKTMTMLQIFEDHHVGTRYVQSNYKDILNEMELDGSITAIPSSEKRRKLKGKTTFSDATTVIFK